MLCKPCHQLFRPVDFSTLHDDQISVAYSQQDTFPACPKITASADAGCRFCAALIKSIRKRWRLLQRDQDLTDSTKTLVIGPMARFFAQSYVQDVPEGMENGLYLLELDARIDGYDRVAQLRFEMFANSASDTAARFTLKRVPPMMDRTGEICAGLLLGWINKCIFTHGGGPCSQELPSDLPTRLIYVGLGYEMEHPRLVISSGRKGRYAALSHCWGPLVPGSRLLRTTSANIEDMFGSIPLESMPQNFQDAVRVTQMIGLQYLWVDSLCIIQDSKIDWEREGAKMGDIYHNAYVTIAATCAGKSEDGFLKVDASDSKTTIPFPRESASEGSHELVLQETDTIASHWQEAVEDVVWNERAWTMQERFLSRRTIHFSKHQIYWECQTGKLSETGELIQHAPITPPDPPWPSIAESVDSQLILLFLDMMYEWWYTIAARYSIRKLTYPSDKLPALSGLAAQMSSSITPFTSHRYLSGIWERDLFHGLLWRYNDMENHKCHVSRAPSWSWAKCDGQVIWRTRQRTSSCTSAALPDVQMLHADVDIVGANPYGEVKGIRLQLMGKVVAVTLHHPDHIRCHPFDPQVPSGFPLDVRQIDSTDAVAVGCLDHLDDRTDGAAYLLHMAKQDYGLTDREDNWSGLLARKVSGVGNEFSRIGVYALREDSLSQFEREEAQIYVLR